MKPSLQLFLLLAVILFVIEISMLGSSDMIGCGFAIAGGLAVHAAAIVVSSDNRSSEQPTTAAGRD